MLIAITSAEVTEAAALNLCLPSPASNGRVREIFKDRVTMDPYGDHVQATAMPGDQWRKGHNKILKFLYN